MILRTHLSNTLNVDFEYPAPVLFERGLRSVREGLRKRRVYYPGS